MSVHGHAGHGASARPTADSTIQKFIDNFNKGDTAGAMATHAAGADLVIIDEMPPFIWRGRKAFQAWSAALDSVLSRLDRGCGSCGDVVTNDYFVTTYQLF